MSLTLLLSISFLLSCTAIQTKQPRIIGGELANAGQFPWAAAIYKTTVSGSYFCGGALLSNTWLLTAGQCVDGATAFTVILGITRLDDEENQLRVDTETYFLHPDYNPETLENDIGIIKLQPAITFTTYINQILLPVRALESEVHVTLVGWGQTDDSDPALSNDLRFVDVSTLSNDDCKTYYGSQIKDQMLCVSGPSYEGSCYGDTGGALVVPSNFSLEQHVHYGIASFVGADGCESNNPSGYIRTYPYFEWIINVTRS